MTLLDKQKKFTELTAQLIQYAISLGYGVTFGEAWRSPETQGLYVQEGKGIQRSLHTLRLALDINLFLSEKYLTDNISYLELGEYWESLSTFEYKCIWGGRFSDANHFSIEHDKIK